MIYNSSSLLYIFRGVLPGGKWRALDPAGTDIM
jgi:hypothetical protein